MALNDSTDYTSLLADIAGKKTLVTLYNGNGNSVDEVVLPITGASQRPTLPPLGKSSARLTPSVCRADVWDTCIYARWTTPASVISTPTRSENMDKEGIVIDTRWNGGGRLHEDIEMLFSGDKYLTQVIRGTECATCPRADGTNPASCSNVRPTTATPTAHRGYTSTKAWATFRGMPVPGTMTSVNWETLQDPVAHIRHSGNRISYCRRQLSGKYKNRSRTPKGLATARYFVA